MNRGKPSSTALYIAKKLVFAADEPGVGPLVPAEAVEMSRRYYQHVAAGGERQLNAYRRPWFRALARWIERVTVPGMTLHYVLRKLRLEEIARESVLGGCSQIVVLGAGFDTLTQRLAADSELHGLTLIELDHPSTQSAKVDVLRLYGLLDDRVEYLPCDLGVDDLAKALERSKRFSADARTLFVAEGLLMYLHPDEVQELIASIYRLTQDGGRFAFTFMEMLPGGRIAFREQSRLVDLWLKWRGEPFQWGLGKEWMTPFLEHRGFDLLELNDADDFRGRYLAPLGLSTLALADGDHLVLAERRSPEAGVPAPVEENTPERPFHEAAGAPVPQLVDHPS